MAKIDWKGTKGTVASVVVTQDEGRSIYEVVFTYKVDGHWFGGTFTSFEAYQEGDSLAVRYDSNAPDRNNLVQREMRGRWLIGIAVAVVVIVSILFRIFH